MQEDTYNGSHRFVRGWSISVIVIAAFFVILLTGVYISYQHHKNNLNNFLNEDRIVAKLLSVSIQERKKAIIGSLQSYASRPLLIDAAKKKNFFAAMRELGDFKKDNADIESVFISDKEGNIWAINPPFEEIIGRNYAYRDWYKGVSRHWKPYVSNAQIRTIVEKDVITFTSVPIFNEKGIAIGIISAARRAATIAELINQVRLSPDAKMNVVDRTGKMIYSDRPEYKNQIIAYPFFSLIGDASMGAEKTIVAKDPAAGGGIRYISFVSMKDIGWTVIIAREKLDVIRDCFRYFFTVALVSILLFLLIVISLVYIKKAIINRQISELFEAERALKDNAERFRLAVNATNDVVWDWNLLTDEIWWADNLDILFGYKGKEAETTIASWINHIHPGDKERVVSGIHAAIESGKRFWSDEYRFQRSDDSDAYILDRGYIMHDDAGKPVRMIGAMTDKTAIKRAEEDIKNERDFIDLILNTSPVFFVAIDKQGKTLKMNRYLLDVLEYSEDEVNGKDYVSTFVPEADREALKMVFKDIVNEKKATLNENSIISKTKKIYLVEWRGQPVYCNDGSFDFFVGVGVDITERTRSEQALKAGEQRWKDLFERTTNAIAIYEAIDDGEDFVFRDFNPAGERIELVRRENIIGHRVTEIFPGVKDFGLFDILQRVWRTGNPEHLDVGFYKDERIAGWRENNIFKIATGEIVVVYEDVTAKKQAEEALQRLNEELEQRVRDRTAQLEAVIKELDAFAYSVSHDLRAPLRSIDGFSRIMLEEQQDRLDEKGKDYLRRVCAGSQRMGELIDDLLRLSRVSRAELIYADVDLSGLAHMIADELQKVHPERTVQFEIADGIIGRGDSQLLRIVLENLFDNAFKFTRDNKNAKIEFGIDKKVGELFYFIRDNGVGFDMEYSNKLFGVFQRLHARSAFEGTGIGLATVQRIIYRHGGRIWAEAEVGRGATFYFTL